MPFTETCRPCVCVGGGALTWHSVSPYLWRAVPALHAYEGLPPRPATSPRRARERSRPASPARCRCAERAGARLPKRMGRLGNRRLSSGNMVSSWAARQRARQKDNRFPF